MRSREDHYPARKIGRQGQPDWAGPGRRNQRRTRCCRTARKTWYARGRTPRLVGVSPRTLEKHRIYGTGPSYSKVSGRVFYAIGDLTEWAKRGAKHSMSDPGKTTVPGAIPANRRATKLEGGVR